MCGWYIITITGGHRLGLPIPIRGHFIIIGLGNGIRNFISTTTTTTTTTTKEDDTNLSKMKKISKYRGVSHFGQGLKSWRTQIAMKSVMTSLGKYKGSGRPGTHVVGNFEDEIEAALAYDEVLRKHGTISEMNNYLNFPNQNNITIVSVADDEKSHSSVTKQDINSPYDLGGKQKEKKRKREEEKQISQKKVKNNKNKNEKKNTGKNNSIKKKDNNNNEDDSSSSNSRKRSMNVANNIDNDNNKKKKEYNNNDKDDSSSTSAKNQGNNNNKSTKKKENSKSITKKDNTNKEDDSSSANNFSNNKSTKKKEKNKSIKKKDSNNKEGDSSSVSANNDGKKKKKNKNNNSIKNKSTNNKEDDSISSNANNDSNNENKKKNANNDGNKKKENNKKNKNNNSIKNKDTNNKEDDSSSSNANSDGKKKKKKNENNTSIKKKNNNNIEDNSSTNNYNRLSNVANNDDDTKNKNKKKKNNNNIKKKDSSGDNGINKIKNIADDNENTTIVVANENIKDDSSSNNNSNNHSNNKKMNDKASLLGLVVGDRIAFDFGSGIYFGSIDECDTFKKVKSAWNWNVTFDDGDRYKFDYKDMLEGVTLYEKIKIDEMNDPNREKKVKKIKDNFFTQQKIVLSKIPEIVEKQFLQVGFALWQKIYLPVMYLGPYDVSPGPVRDEWLAAFEKCEKSKVPQLVYWFGNNSNGAFSVLELTSCLSFEEGKRRGLLEQKRGATDKNRFDKALVQLKEVLKKPLHKRVPFVKLKEEHEHLCGPQADRLLVELE